jgi:O-antigen/teichoic acid export membrane protein
VESSADRSSPGDSPFARRVSSVFGTQVLGFGFGLAASLLLRKVMPGTDFGTFVAVTTFPGTLSALGMFGLPNAVNYFAGKGSSVASLVRLTFVLTAILSVVLIGAVWVILPLLEGSYVSAARTDDTLLRIMLLTLPLSVLASFGGSILYGRQDVRVYNVIQVVQAIGSLVCAVVLVWWLRLGLAGAVAGSVLMTMFLTLGVLEAVRRLSRRDRSGSPADSRALASYGFRLYPASLSGYFNYRADFYILQAVITDSRISLANYSMAVIMAELVFFVPNSVATILLPRVAGATADDANQMLGRVARLSMLVTVCVALALIPTAFLGIHLVLPRYADCLPAFYVLLPAVVTFSMAKVMTSYISGRGHAGLVSIAITVALVLNVAANFILIPLYGIVGASMASLLSYTAHATITLFMASRLSGQPLRSLLLPGRTEAVLFVTGLWRLTERLPLIGGVR